MRPPLDTIRYKLTKYLRLGVWSKITWRTIRVLYNQFSKEYCYFVLINERTKYSEINIQSYKGRLHGKVGYIRRRGAVRFRRIET